MTHLILILLGIVLSFVGSIPFGTINVTVIESAISRGLRAAAWVTAGAALIEFIQALLALKFSGLITRYPLTEQILFWTSIPVFAGLGYYYLRQKPTSGHPQHVPSHGQGFMKGVIVSSLNMLAIPYWIFYGTYLSSIGWMDLAQDMHILMFSSGVLAGSVTILTVYARIAVYARTRFASLNTHITRWVAYFFFVLAAIQIARALAALL